VRLPFRLPQHSPGSPRTGWTGFKTHCFHSPISTDLKYRIVSYPRDFPRGIGLWSLAFGSSSFRNTTSVERGLAILRGANIRFNDLDPGGRVPMSHLPLLPTVSSTLTRPGCSIEVRPQTTISSSWIRHSDYSRRSIPTKYWQGEGSGDDLQS
jgi:hypothetical protein